MEQADLIIEKTVLEIDKLKLEKDKLDQEIRHLKRPLALNPIFLSPIIAILLTIFGFLITRNSGWWDVQKARLEKGKLLLQLDVNQFERERDALQFQVDWSRELQNTLAQRIGRSTVIQDSLRGINTALNTEITRARGNLKNFAKRYKAEKESIAKELDEIDILLRANQNNVEAYNRLTLLVLKLKGLTEQSFSNDFSDDFK